MPRHNGLLRASAPRRAVDRLVVAGGAQSALFAICSLVAARSSICAGSITYPGLKSVAAALDLAIHPLDMDEHGIIPDRSRNAAGVIRQERFTSFRP